MVRAAAGLEYLPIWRRPATCTSTRWHAEGETRGRTLDRCGKPAQWYCWTIRMPGGAQAGRAVSGWAGQASSAPRARHAGPRTPSCSRTTRNGPNPLLVPWPAPADSSRDTASARRQAGPRPPAMHRPVESSVTRDYRPARRSQKTPGSSLATGRNTANEEVPCMRVSSARC
jgi:hypothetical protein